MKKILPTDLARLAEEVCKAGYRAAFPTALADRWIRSIARDLRQVELALADPTGATTDAMAGPLLISVHIMTGRLKERQIESPIVFTVSGMQRWIQVFHFAIEREIVARYTGVRISSDEETLIAALDLEINSLRDEASEDDE